MNNAGNPAKFADAYGTMYSFEHAVLPQLYFDKDKKVQFVYSIVKVQNKVWQLADILFRSKKLANPFSPQDFAVDSKLMSEHVMAVKIVFPEPPDEPLCYCAYLIFDSSFQNMMYFCIEKGNDEYDYIPYVCGWTAKRVHLNYGNCSPDLSDAFTRCWEIYCRTAADADK